MSVLATDLAFPQNMMNEFLALWMSNGNGWEGEATRTATIRTLLGELDPQSVDQALESLSPSPSNTKPRIIVVTAHSEHIFQILKQAHASNFPRDAVWVWATSDEFYGSIDLSWLPNVPGYLRLATHRNRDENYQGFLSALQRYQRSKGKDVFDELPTYAAEMVDSVRALVQALAVSADRRDGTRVVETLRSLEFAGVSGRVSFDQYGDRANPFYSVYNAVNGSSAGVKWKHIGTTGTSFGSTDLTDGIESVCFPERGCGLSTAVSDSYAVVSDSSTLAVWVLIFILSVAALLMFTTAKYWRSRKSKKKVKAALETLQNAVKETNDALPQEPPM